MEQGGWIKLVRGRLTLVSQNRHGGDKMKLERKTNTDMYRDMVTDGSIRHHIFNFFFFLEHKMKTDHYTVSKLVMPYLAGEKVRFLCLCVMSDTRISFLCQQGVTSCCLHLYIFFFLFLGGTTVAN